MEMRNRGFQSFRLSISMWKQLPLVLLIVGLPIFALAWVSSSFSNFEITAVTLALLIFGVLAGSGVVVLYERNRSLCKQVTEANRELVEVSTVVSAIAAENARLYEMAKTQRMDEQAALLQLSSDLNGTLNVDEVLDRAVGNSASILKAEYCAIMTIHEDRGLIFRAVRGWDASQVGLTPHPDLVHHAEAALTKKGAVRTNEKKIGLDANNPLLSSEGQRPVSGLVLPILRHDRAIGVVMVHMTKPHRFREEEVRLLSLIANQTAVSLENAALYQQQRRQAEKLSLALSELNRTYRTTLEALSSALDTRDKETEGHSQRVTLYAAAIAKTMGVQGDELVNMERGALLHDVGKIGIPDAILLKPGGLSTEEWGEMKKHPLVGFRMLSKIDFLEKALPVILHHHERFDGKGYPLGLAGEAIPLGARIFAVADTLDAITSDRPYRNGRSFDVAKEEILRNSGAQFDPQVVEAFLSITRAEWEHWVNASAQEVRDILPSFTLGLDSPVDPASSPNVIPAAS